MFFNPDVLMEQVHSHYETERYVQGHSSYERVEFGLSNFGHIHQNMVCTF